MTTLPVRSWCIAGLLTILSLAPALRAQNALYAEHEGKFRPVRRAEGTTAIVADDSGKLVQAKGERYSLAPIPEYAPYFVSFHNIKAAPRAIQLSVGTGVNHEYGFKGEIVSQGPLDNVFIVLELNQNGSGKILSLNEVGRLQPHIPHPFDIAVPLGQRLGDSEYQVNVNVNCVPHVFVGGLEVFNSEMPAEKMQQALDEMVKRHIAGVKDAGPKALLATPPEYPESLRGTQMKGRAVVHFTISSSGQVVDPTVKEATAPAFGDAAVAAVSHWRFVPKIKGGEPVQAVAELPFVFDAPPPAASPAQ